VTRATGGETRVETATETGATGAEDVTGTEDATVGEARALSGGAIVASTALGSLIPKWTGTAAHARPFS